MDSSIYLYIKFLFLVILVGLVGVLYSLLAGSNSNECVTPQEMSIKNMQKILEMNECLTGQQMAKKALENAFQFQSAINVCVPGSSF